MSKLLFILVLSVATAGSARAEFTHPGWGGGAFVPGRGGWGGGRGWPGPVGGPGPFFVPYPGWVPGPEFGAGYVFTCFAQNAYGQAFSAVAPDANLALGQAMQACAMSGTACVPAGCR